MGRNVGFRVPYYGFYRDDFEKLPCGRVEKKASAPRKAQLERTFEL